MLFTGPELPIKGVLAGNPHWQLQTKKRMEERNQGRRIPAQLSRIKDPVGFGKEVTGKVPTELAIGRQAA